MNGEYLNATCGSGSEEDAARYVTLGVTWLAAGTGGWGCNGTWAPPDPMNPLAGTSCVNGTWLFAMGYSSFAAEVGGLAVVRTPADERQAFAYPGLIQGGTCSAPPDPKTGLPIGGGYCACDNIGLGRLAFPSAALRPGAGGRYDYYFQGWAGANCSIPCAPCSRNGLCNATDGSCVCAPGWTGYRCLTPCEPCVNGACQLDGTCLCSGSRRNVEGTYALRLSRDPFFFERGVHRFVSRGMQRQEYVHPAYMTTATVEDFIWEARPTKLQKSGDSLPPWKLSPAPCEPRSPVRPGGVRVRAPACLRGAHC